MAGRWEATASGDTREEYWTVPRGKTMLGIARLVHTDSVMMYEENRLVRAGDALFTAHLSTNDTKPLQRGRCYGQYRDLRIVGCRSAFDTKVAATRYTFVSPIEIAAQSGASKSRYNALLVAPMIDSSSRTTTLHILYSSALTA